MSGWPSCAAEPISHVTCYMATIDDCQLAYYYLMVEVSWVEPVTGIPILLFFEAIKLGNTDINYITR